MGSFSYDLDDVSSWKITEHCRDAMPPLSESVIIDFSLSSDLQKHCKELRCHPLARQI